MFIVDAKTAMLEVGKANTEGEKNSKKKIEMRRCWGNGETRGNILMFGHRCLWEIQNKN